VFIARNGIEAALRLRESGESRDPRGREAIFMTLFELEAASKITIVKCKLL
jgi:hypothetical protein